MSAFAGSTPRDLRDGALARLQQLVELESPSHDQVQLRALAGHLAAELVSVGAEVDTVDVEVGEHLVARIPGRDGSLEPLLILTHLDTVHPVGSFDPVFRLEDDRAVGPGAFDMKGGVACVLEAMARLHDAATPPRRPVIVLITCDEETGSETSRELIEELAAGAHAVLVPEPPLPDGSAKTRRKGVAWYTVQVTGRASHAGLAPEAGVNAIVELTHQVLAISALEDRDAGTTVNVGVVEGGTASNVVPAWARAQVDVRFTTAAEAHRVDAAINALEPTLEGASLTISGGINRMPMERTAATASLFERARELAAEDGWELGEGLAGGASDGSFTAALGIPTLDGIGPRGGGAHAHDEHVLLQDLAPRVLLLGRLLERL
jgi:glutamate carboxypeptidase